jgi:TP901 family phage tail tape measure protein
MPATPAAGGTTPLYVTIRITTTGVKSATSGMNAVTNASQKMTRGMGQGVITARTLGDSMRMTASLMKYTVAGGFMKIGQAAVQAFRNFELSFSRIRGLVGVSADAVEEMKKGVLGLAGATTKGPEELAEALYFITSSGIRDTSTVMSVLESSAKASAAGMGETTVVADALTSALQAYGMGNLSAANATDILVAAVREGKAEADTFAPAFSKVLPVSAAFGASFNDVAAAMAALTRSGMTAGTAGIYVRQVLSQLLKPSKQARDALASVGTSAEQVRNDIRDKGLFEGLSNLSEKLGGTDEGAENFAKVFGNVRALTAMLQLVGPAAAENEEVFRRMSNTTGDLDHAFMSYAETVDKEFAEAFANSRVALIKLGEALKPLVTSMLNISQVVSKAFSFLFDLIGKTGLKAFVSFAGVSVVLVAGLAMVIQTTSALIRLFANMTMTLFGTQIMYDANTKSLYRLTAATSSAAAATGTAAMTAKGYTKVNFSLLGSIKFLIFSIKYYTVTAYLSVKANGLLTASMMGLRAAAIKLGVAFKFLMAMPLFAKLTILALAIGGIIKLISKLNKESPASNLIDQMGKVNELLDQTVAYGTVKIGFKIEAPSMEATKLEEDVKRMKEQITEQAPELLNELEKLGEVSRGAMANTVKGLMESQFANLQQGSKDALMVIFQKELGLTGEEYAAAVIGNVTGDAVADGLIQVAVSAAGAANSRVSDAMAKTGKEGLDGFIEVLEGAGKVKINPATDRVEYDSQNVLDSLGVMGQGFTDFIQTSSDMTPLLLTLQKLDEKSLATEGVFKNVLGGALKGLSGDLDLADESGGNFFKIFADPKNADELQNLIMKTAKIADTEAQLAVAKIKSDMDSFKGSKTSAEGFKLVMAALDPYLIAQDDSVKGSARQLAAFEAEQEMIREQISAYSAAEAAIKKYSDAQRALRGLAQSQEEAQRDALDSFNDVSNAIKDSGGSISITTSGGREAREELTKSAEAVMNYANTLAAEGDMEGAGLAFQQGMEHIVKTVASVGGEGAGIDAALFLENLGFTKDNFISSLTATADAVEGPAIQTGEDVAAGIAQGIQSGQKTMSDALVRALQGVMITGQDYLKIKSPSQETANKLGIPMAQGIGKGFEKEMKSGRTKSGLQKSLDSAITGLYKTGTRASISKYLENFLKKKKAVETPAQDFVKATIGRMKDIIGSLGAYIKSQLSFREAQSNLAKLINMQRSYDDQRKKAAREVQYSETRLGGGGGAEVTGYEQAQIDQLQLEFERVSRDYAMGRATYVDLVDAEIALYEARAAASEVSEEVIGTQNAFIDKSVQLENKNLELASATVDVLSAYQDVQEAAYELYINHKELAGVYDSLATATGIASGQIVVGSTNLSTLGTSVNTLGGFSSTVGGYVSTLGNNIGITGQAFSNNFYGETGIFKTLTNTGSNVKTLTTSIGANFVNLSRGLLDEDSEMYKNLKSLGPAIFNSIQLAAQESLDKSPLTLRVSVNAIVDTSGGSKLDTPGSPFGTKLTKSQFDEQNKGAARASVARSLGVGSQFGGAQNLGPEFERLVAAELAKMYRTHMLTAKAVGGPVYDKTPYMVGERGPEMFVPRVSGTIVTASALDRYTRVKQAGPSRQDDAPGKTIVVTVNNPVPAAAEDSITRRMKVLANSGLFG